MLDNIRDNDEAGTHYREVYSNSCCPCVYLTLKFKDDDRIVICSSSCEILWMLWNSSSICQLKM